MSLAITYTKRQRSIIRAHSTIPQAHFSGDFRTAIPIVESVLHQLVFTMTDFFDSIERPSYVIYGSAASVRACYPRPSFPECEQPAVYLEMLSALFLGLVSVYKFVTLFFFYISSRNPATRKAIYFWFFGVLLNCFLVVIQITRHSLEEMVYRIWSMILIVVDMWPFLLVTQLILDVFGDTGAFTAFEVVACQGLTRLFWIYSLVFPVATMWLVFYGVQILQRNAFLIPSYIILFLFVAFFCHVVFRLFVCEKYIAAFFIGEKALLKFQIGVFVVAIALLLKMVFLVWFEIPPDSLEGFSIIVSFEEHIHASTVFYSLSHSFVYMVPYLVIAMGANFARSRSEIGPDTHSESSHSALTMMLLEN